MDTRTNVWHLSKKRMGPCMSAMAGAAGVPTIDFPAADVADKTKEILVDLPNQVDSTEATLKGEWETAKAKDEDYNIMGGELGKAILMTISKTAEEKEVRKAAYLQVAKGKFADDAAAQVWTSIEPQIDANKPNIPDTPLMTGDQIWSKAKDKVKDQVQDAVSKQIQAAIDELIKKNSAL